MNKSIYRKNILKEASVLLITLFIVLSTFIVTGNYVDTNSLVDVKTSSNWINNNYDEDTRLKQISTATEWIKYNDGSTENGLGLTNGGIISEAIELSTDKLTGYREYVISEIKVSIGCDAYGAESGVPYQVWIGNSLPSDPTNANIVASGISSSSVWNLINVVDTPIPDSGSIFIGVNFDHDGGEYPCGIDESTSIPSNAGLLWTSSSGWTNLGGVGFPGVWGLSIGVTLSANNPPKTPSKPTGPVTGEYDVEYSYTTSTTDPDGDKVKYGWEWTGDNTVDSWTDFENSGVTCGLKLIFDDVGTYYLKVKAEDEHGAQSSFSQPLTIIIESGNKAPNTPNITGPSEGKIETFYDYTISTVDPEGDNILYWIDWGDGKNSGWLGPYLSGETILISHFWGETEDYLIKVIAKDILGKESDFSAPIHMMVTSDLEIDVILRPSGFGVAATIVNRGRETAVMTSWNITLDGGIILYGKYKESNITEIPPGDVINAFSLVFGLLNINITATVGNSSDSIAGFLIGPFFSSNNDEKTYDGRIIKVDSIKKEVIVQLVGVEAKKTFRYDSDTKFLDIDGNPTELQGGDLVKVTWILNKNGDTTERLAIEIHQQYK